MKKVFYRRLAVLLAAGMGCFILAPVAFAADTDMDDVITYSCGGQSSFINATLACVLHSSGFVGLVCGVGAFVCVAAAILLKKRSKKVKK